MAKREWDLASTNSLQGAAEWTLKKAGEGALVVIVIRVDDLAIAADRMLLPRDVVSLLEDRAELLHQTLQAERTKQLGIQDRKRAKGKL